MNLIFGLTWGLHVASLNTFYRCMKDTVWMYSNLLFLKVALFKYIAQYLCFASQTFLIVVEYGFVCWYGWHLWYRVYHWWFPVLPCCARCIVPRETSTRQSQDNIDLVLRWDRFQEEISTPPYKRRHSAFVLWEIQTWMLLMVWASYLVFLYFLLTSH